MSVSEYRRQPVWPYALMWSAVGLAVLVACGTWVFGVYSMSDPATSFLVGMRIDGSRVSVKAPTCPTDRVGTAEVYDSDSEKLLWRARVPRTEEGRRGSFTLWSADDFLKPGAQKQPGKLPRYLDVSVTYAGGDDGTGDVFDLRKVRAAHLTAGQYWTTGGPRTAAQIDAQFSCRTGEPAQQSD
ncbi:hypothetical protein ABZZ74_05755 [Streptomyces sp. NPDC006476]|uniref:hypothetical protein n=1 Tax=Streptomyces sp. NPDC006476 TaxID=3157175 RepID=UPI0033BE273B